MDELEKIVQRMIDAGESEEAIALVIEEYNSDSKTEEGKTTPTDQDMSVDVTEVSEITESPSEDGSLELKETKYKTPLTRDEKISLQNNKFSKQMSKEDNFTKERLEELQGEDEDEVNILESLAARTAKGFVGAGKGISQTQDMLMLGLMSFNNDFTPEEKIIAKELLESGDIGSPSGFLTLPSTDSFKELEEILSKSVRKTDNESITQAISSGDYAEAAELTVGGALESIPSLLAAFTGYGGIAMLGASVAGNKFDEELRNNPEEAISSLTLNAIGSGAIESGFEIVTKGLLTKAGFIKNTQSVKAAKDFIQKGSESLIKKLGLSTLGEGASEAATELTSIAFDNLQLGKETSTGEMWNRSIDAFIIGGFVGGNITSASEIGGASTAARSRAEYILTPQEIQKKYQGSAAQLSELSKSLKNANTPESKKVILEQMEAIEQKIVKAKGEVSRSLNELTPEELIEYASNQEQILEKTNVVKDQTDENIIKTAKDQIEGLNQANIDLFGVAAQRILDKDIAFTESEASKYGLEVEVFENSEDFGNAKGVGVENIKADGVVIGNKVLINKERASKVGAVSVGSHELLHAILKNAISSGQAGVEIIDNFKAQLNSSQKKAVEARLKAKDSNGNRLYSDKYLAKNPDEYLTAFSDAIQKKEISFEENIFTKIGDLITPLLRKIGWSKIEFNTGKDVYDFMREYNKSITQGALSKDIVEATGGEVVFEEIVKSNTNEQASNKVQELYDAQGEAAAFDIIEQFKPITNKIVEKRSQAPGFDRQLLTDEVETGKRGILDLIKEYKPESGVPLAAYINKFLPARAIEASKRILGEEFTDDVTEAKGVAAEEVAVDVVSTDKQATSKLRRVLGIKQGDEIYDLAKEVSGEILSSDLPGKKVKTAVNKKARESKLRKAVSDLMGTEKAIDEQFLNKNILEVLKALPASDLVKLEREAKVKVLAEQGPRLNVKDAREAVNKGKLPKDTNLKSGPKVSSKLPTTLEQAKEFFTQKRKAGLVNVVTEILVKDAAPEVTEGKIEPAKRAKVLSEIDRLPTLKFSLTTEQENKLDDLENTINNITEGPGKDAIFENLKEEFLTFTTQKDLDFKDLQGIIDVALEDEVLAGKEGARFTKETDNLNYYDLTDKNKLKFDLKNTESLKKVGKKRLKPANTSDVNEFIGHALTLAEAMPTEGKILLGRRKTFIPGALLGYHTRTTGDGKLDNFYKALSKNPNAKWISPKTKELLDNVKTIIPASSFRNVQKKIGEATSKEEKIAIAKKALPDLIKHQESSLDFFNAFNSLLTDYLYDSKNQKEFESRLDYVLKLKRANSDNVKGERDLVILDGFYLGKPNGPIKLEHVKSSSQQSVQSLKSIVSGQWDTSIANDFKGMFGYKNDFDGIDAYGKTNTSQYYRFYNKNIASNYILSEFGFDGTVYDKNLINAVEADLIKLKQKAAVNNNNELPELVKFSKNSDYTNNMVLDRMAEIDNDSQESELKFSKSLDLDKDFNDIIENKTGIASDKTYARVKAEVAGANKGRFNFFIPPSAEDFVGLLYSTLGKGNVGDAQMAWYKAHLLNPFARAMENLANDRVTLMEDFKGLKKALKIVPKNLRKKIKDSDFTKEQAVRVAIWNKQGMTVPGLSQKDQQELVDYVNNDADLTVFADQLIAMGKGDAYAAPDGGWVAGTIDTDFIKALNTVKRDKYLEVWQQNVDQIFSETNLNKLEAAYGKPYRESMENMLKRMSTGRNTNSGSDNLTARFTDWLTNSVGAIMFFNTRSAVLQTISAVNFVNFSDNNILKAGQAFANQPQYWSDFKKLFNSPFLLDRRSGLKLNVNEADIADMAKGPGNSARNVIAGILKAGFLPTQLADSFAIASGGASFYRNRIKALQKEGLTKTEAEDQAFRDFREIAEESQQSSRPDKISQQQAGPLGRVVLAFANTPAQYARLIKKAASDLKNGRGDAKTNISKIIYYGVAQNLLFSALQQALFALAFDDDEEDKKKDEKYFNIVNGMSDSILRGIGLGGAIVSVVKNTAIRLAKEADKKSPKYQDAVVKGVLQISPPISSKIGKLQSAGRSYSWNKQEMRAKGWAIDNPAYLANANVISALTNVPLDRAVKKITNIVDASNEETEYYKRIALALGWSAWELNIKKEKFKKSVKSTVKSRNRTRSKSRSKKTRN